MKRRVDLKLNENSRGVLEAKGISKSFENRKVVDKVSLYFEEGEIVGLLGPNGAGKTTTFGIIIGEIEPDEGRVYLDGEDITDLPMYKRARKGISYLPQETSIFKKLTVFENLMIIAEMTEMGEGERMDKINHLLYEFGLYHLRSKKGNTLSGGERRRVEIARSLILNPKFILLDEPFAGVDPLVVADIQELVSQLKDRNIGVVITDHNVRDTLKITDRAYIITEGRIFKSGRPVELAGDEDVKRVYLGKDFEL